MDIKGRVALVTGGGSGLGKATVLALAGAGARVAALDRDRDAAQHVATEAGSVVLPIEVDIADEQSVSRAFAEIRRTYGLVDICVNCAGVATPGGVVTDTGALSLEKFQKVIDINLIGLFDVMRLSTELMIQNEPGVDDERGVIINVSSGAAWQGQRGQAAYAASKAAVIGLMLPAARDLARYGIRVITVAPGAFDTGMFSGLSEATIGEVTNMVLYPRRLGRPDEFANLVRHIIANRYLNATTISLDAGVRLF